MRMLVSSPRLSLFILPLLAAALLAGCTGERPAPPLAPPVEQVASLTLWADGVEIANIKGREGITWLCTKLPPEEARQLLDTGSLTTDDPAFKAGVIRWLETHPEARRGYAAGVIRVTWGDIKAQYRG